MFLKGILVNLPDGKGVGKLESADGTLCAISIFYSIIRSEMVRLPTSALSRAYLFPQTRVYALKDDSFKVGRITDYKGRDDNGLIEYEVRFPNGDKRNLFESELFLRPWSTPDDPAEVMANGGAESQYLHDRRQAAMRPLFRLRSAAQGLTALPSAGIEFVPHQIAAVRRVLTDPVQRYLLADEVGLGKTIEAGLIIRQHLIDNPKSIVLITVPRHLCDRWRQELNTKLRLDQFANAFEVCPHAELANVHRQPDILIVDEAHHLVGVASGPLKSAAERLRSLSESTPVLLLLSATPPLGDTARFLALLSLLDPVSHKANDVDGFRAKLESRREIGRLLLALDPQAPGLVLRQRGSDLLRLFADDLVVAELAPQLTAATRDAPATLPELCARLKSHIADTYRINQRLIRSRRADAEGWEFAERGPASGGEPSFAHLKVESEDRGWIEPLLGAIEDWRFAALEAMSDDTKALDQAASRYVEMLTAAGVGPATLIVWLDRAGISETFAEERSILASLRTLASDIDVDNSMSMMAQSTRRLLRSLKSEFQYPKVVVFSSSKERAAEFFYALSANSEGAEVLLLADGVAEEHGDAVAAFAAPRKSAVLVCDQESEEGLNLAFADAIIHLDLPFSAVRIEQRIGRLDRFGRKHGIVRHRILLPWEEEHSPWATWLRFLMHGLSIFHRSISDVQFLLENIEQEVFRALFRNTVAEGVDALAVSVRERIDKERLSQDEQYALDRIALSEEPIKDFLKTLEEAEEDEASLEKGVDRWLVEALRLQKRYPSVSDRDSFRLVASRDTLIPRQPWLEAFGLDRDRQLTWKRTIATRHPETTLLRPGTPLIDVVERFTRWDDRGTAFITWRTAPEWEGEVCISFRLCFVIEPNVQIVDLLDPSSADLANARRAQRYFRLHTYTVHVDVNSNKVTDPVLLEILRRPYSKKGDRYGEHGQDINLSSKPHILSEVIDAASFSSICLAVRDGVSGRLLADEMIAKAIGRGVRVAQAAVDRRRNRLMQRRSSGDGMAQVDTETIEKLLPAIQHPAVRLDSMGCFIVANTPPRQTVDA